MLKRCSAILFVVVCLLIGSCQGYGDPPGPSEPAAEPITITFAVPDTEEVSFVPLVQQFQSAYPDIRVQLISTNTYQPLEQTARGADVALVPAAHITETAAGFVRDLAPEMDADGSFDRADYFPAALAPAGSASVYLLPRALFVPLFHYNADLWSENNLPTPDANWTWMDLFAATSQIAGRGTSVQRTQGWLDDSAGMTPLIGLLDATNALDDVLTSAEVAAALTQVVALRDSGAILELYTPDTQVVEQETILQLIRDQRVLAWPAQYTPSQEGTTLPFERGVAVQPPLPMTSMVSDGYVISAGSRHPDAAWQWLAFLSQHSALPNTGEFLLPARQSLAVATLDQYDAATVRAVTTRAQQQDGGNVSNPALHALLRAALTATLNGDETAEQAAQRFQGPAVAAAPTAVAGPATPFVVPAPEATPSGDEIQIIFNSHTLGLAGNEQVRRIAQQFASDYPGLKVVVTEQAAGGGDRVGLPEVAQGSDCFFWHAPPMSHERVLLADLRPLLDADASLPPGEYPPGVLLPFEADGALYGLPFQVALRGITYDAQRFDAAGIAYPSPDWTAQDLFAAAEQLSDITATPAPYYGFALAGDFHSVMILLDMLDAAIVLNTTDPPALNYTNPDVVQALQTMIDFLPRATPHQQLTSYARSAPYEPVSELIENKQVAIWFDFVLPLAGETETHLVPPIWGRNGPTTNDLGVFGLYITAESPHAETCWQWLSYISSEVTLFTEFFPARRSVAESAAFRAQLHTDAAALYDAYAAALAQPGGVSRTPNQYFFPPYDRFWLYRAIDRALQGADLEQELVRAQVITEQHIHCVRSGGKWVECAFAVDPEYDGFPPPEGWGS